MQFKQIFLHSFAHICIMLRPRAGPGTYAGRDEGRTGKGLGPERGGKGRGRGGKGAEDS